MKKRLNRFECFVFGLMLVGTYPLRAQQQSSDSQLTRKYSNEFLEIGVDARSLAMGKSVVGHIQGADAVYWNPAGLAAHREGIDASLMHAEYFASIAKFDYASVAIPVDNTSTIGISFIRFGVDDIMDTSNLIDGNGNVDYDRIRKFSAADYALFFSYARASEKIEGLSYGANVKMIYRSLGRFASGYGFGFDLGMQYETPKKWHFGVVARDVTTTFNAWDIRIDDDLQDVFEQTGNEMPEDNLEITLPKLILGLGKTFALGSRYSLITECNAGFTFDGRRNAVVTSDVVSMYPSIGAEVGYMDFVFLRLGAGDFQREMDFDFRERVSWMPSMGIGFSYRGISLSYALTDIGNQSTAIYSNIFSLNATFGGKNTLL